jgi:integrase
MAGESSTALAAPPRAMARLVEASLPKYFTRDEVARLVSAARPGRDRLIVRTLWETGLRVSELLTLTSASIDFAAEALQVATLKRRAHLRTVPIRPALLGDLARHIAGNGIAADARLFRITRQRVHQIVVGAAAEAGLSRDRAHPHTLRHSFAIACVLARVPVLVLAEWLGHATLAATLVYTKILCADSRRYLGDVDFG